jgi:hypothetical protein
VIGVTFERLGKERRLEISTPSPSLDSIRDELRRELPRACASILLSHVVVESNLKYFEEEVFPRTTKENSEG